MRRFKTYLCSLAIVVASLMICQCTPDSKGDGAFDVQFDVPSAMTVQTDALQATFRIMFGKAPASSDKVLFNDATGKQNECSIIEITEKNFTVKLYEGIATGTYKIYVKRGKETKFMGSTELTVKYVSEADKEINVKDGNNVYGIVSCGSKGIKGVVVSDGNVVTTTDADGIYQFKSNKKNGYVFISVPSGYHPAIEGVFPKFYQTLTKNALTPERADFPLTDAGDQTNHTMLVFGDMHLANRTSSNNDMGQFNDFVKEVNDYVSANKDKKLYGLTLGDMTWDLYWVSNSFDLTNYVTTINKINNLPIYHTIGNHDHEMAAAGDFDTVIKYKKIIGPTYFSFNIGNIHYVVLDDIECTNDGSGTSASRTYNNKVVSEEIDWLKKDLAYVSKTTPIVVTMHAPLYNDGGGFYLKNGSDLADVLKAYSQVQVITGHTHKMYNIDNMSSSHIYEHNSGAVCATWWWNGKYFPGLNIAQDGAPGGYRIVTVNGDNLKWQYKGTGWPVEHQFRTYDGNRVNLSSDNNIPKASTDGKKYYETYAKDWLSTSGENYVYINVWDYDPSWTVTVTEDGKNLAVDHITKRDPLHILTYLVPSMNKTSATSSSFPTSETKHFFRVKASSSTSTIDITVKDRFGNTYTEKMTRPKSFDANTYKAK